MMSKKSSIMDYSLSGSDLHFKPFVYEGQPIRTKTTKPGDNLKTRRANRLVSRTGLIEEMYQS